RPVTYWWRCGSRSTTCGAGSASSTNATRAGCPASSRAYAGPAALRKATMRARTADTEGFIEHDGVKIHFETYGRGGPTVLLMPTWTIVHKRLWKSQIPYLARHHRVVTYDGPGNGRSDRPVDPRPYGQAAQVAYALKVLEATGTEALVLVALSRA